MKKKLKEYSLKLSQEQLPKRLPNMHKGQAGRVLIIGGDKGMMGAVCLAGEAALRIGSGLVFIISKLDFIATRPELMCRASTELKDLLKKTDVIVLGPGLGQKRWGKGLFNSVLRDATCPIVLDADGLNFLAQEKKIVKKNWILTPHVGEAARLLHVTIDEIEQDRYAAADQLQKKYGGVIVLKGAGTIIKTNDDAFICRAGNPGMATSGMGDVLSGVIASLIGQGLSMEAAALSGVMIHAHAADEASKKGMRGMIASDLFTYLRLLVNP